ncbi:carbonic anhydrase [Streptomyces sp. NPDC002055]|uniref:carbonic anhydrase n=1 Tax=Streptomyces sp. NPDC002055 TaxID=3154534 RepID=UPI0033294F25
MQKYIDSVRAFRQRATASPDELGPLANGQSPDALFITCSDSRVIPSLITGSRPGELFELRTAGNIVPEHLPGKPSSEAATIEYAVQVLGVSDIVVCGHSHCGAVGAMVRGDDLSAVPAVRDWLDTTPPPACKAPDAPDLADAVQDHVLRQLGRLREYPFVARGLADGKLTLHGWFYEVHTGTVFAHRAHDDSFLPL